MTETKDASASASGAEARDVEAVEQEAQEKGYYGETPDYDRDAYTLQTGPESPSTLEATLAAKRADLDAQFNEFKESAKTRAEGAKAKHEERKAARQSKREGE